MSRISTGFHRIGIALAIPFVILAIAWAAIEWNDHRESLRLAEAQAKALQNAKQRAVEAGTLTLEAQERIKNGNVFDPFDGVQEPDYAAPGALAGLAIALYAVSRTIGWIVNGFVGGASR